MMKRRVYSLSDTASDAKMMHTMATEMGSMAMLSCGRLAQRAAHSSGVMPSEGDRVGIVNGGGMVCYALLCFALLRRKVTDSQ